MKIIFLASLIFFLSACSGQKENIELPKYIEYEQLPQQYTIENAIEDQCVVVESELPGISYPVLVDMITSSGETEYSIFGHDTWELFLQSCTQGERALIRIVYYCRDMEGNGENSAVYVMDVLHENGKYIMRHMENDEICDVEFAALQCYEGKYHQKEWYLVSENMKTADYYDVTHIIFSSDSGDSSCFVYFTD